MIIKKLFNKRRSSRKTVVSKTAFSSAFSSKEIYFFAKSLAKQSCFLLSRVVASFINLIKKSTASDFKNMCMK